MKGGEIGGVVALGRILPWATNGTDGLSVGLAVNQQRRCHAIASLRAT